MNINVAYTILFCNIIESLPKGNPASFVPSTSSSVLTMNTKPILGKKMNKKCYNSLLNHNKPWILNIIRLQHLDGGNELSGCGVKKSITVWKGLICNDYSPKFHLCRSLPKCKTLCSDITKWLFFPEKKGGREAGILNTTIGNGSIFTSKVTRSFSQEGNTVNKISKQGVINWVYHKGVWFFTTYSTEITITLEFHITPQNTMWTSLDFFNWQL